ncbi:MAG: hypothetical protein IKZ82_02845, partial [Clostridia bacterium]|nr:hypothetical protein [Clostridia bacterium]
PPESAGDKSKNFFCKGNDHTARKGEKAVASLGGIVAREGKTDLNDAPTQEDQSDGADQSENKVGEIVDNADRIVCGKSCRCRAEDKRPAENCGAVDTKGFPSSPAKGRGLSFL